MKIELDNKDIAHIIRQVKEDPGAYVAACKGEKAARELPWSGPGQFVENILNAIAAHYENNAEIDGKTGVDINGKKS